MSLVRVRQLRNGFHAATERFEEARTSTDSESAYQSIFEALNWAVAFEDRIRRDWVPEGKPLDFAWRDWIAGAHILEAVRWTRNTVHHDWVDALALAEGAAYPRTYPRVYFEWCWRPAAELPVTDLQRPAGRAAYIDSLEGQTVRDTLDRLNEVLSRVTHIIDPPRPVVHGAM